MNRSGAVVLGVIAMSLLLYFGFSKQLLQRDEGELREAILALASGRQAQKLTLTNNSGLEFCREFAAMDEDVAGRFELKRNGEDSLRLLPGVATHYFIGYSESGVGRLALVLKKTSGQFVALSVYRSSRR